MFWRRHIRCGEPTLDLRTRVLLAWLAVVGAAVWLMTFDYTGRADPWPVARASRLSQWRIVRPGPPDVPAGINARPS